LKGIAASSPVRGAGARKAICGAEFGGDFVRLRLAGASEEGAAVRLFTINFELGDKTLETLTRISNNSVIHFELGPKTRAMIERVATPDNGGGRRVGGLLKKGAEALRADS
jgi:hypothetical protein